MQRDIKGTKIDTNGYSRRDNPATSYITSKGENMLFIWKWNQLTA